MISIMGHCSEFGSYFPSQFWKSTFLGHLTIIWRAVVPPGGHESVILFHFTKVLASAHFVAYSTTNIPVLQLIQFVHFSLANFWCGLDLRDDSKKGGCLRGAVVPRVGCGAPKVILPWIVIESKQSILIQTVVLHRQRIRSYPCTWTGALFNTRLSISELEENSFKPTQMFSNCKMEL